MCGIVGYVSRQSTYSMSVDDLRRWTHMFTQRGPAGSGFLTLDGNDLVLEKRGNRYRLERPDHPGFLFGLGHTRLSLNDLTDVAFQPLSNETRDIHLVHNGEVYNHNALREMLQARGHEFSCLSDSEVIIHLYEELGLPGLQMLRGPMAYALLDEQKGELILARDRFGEKPLYYSERPDAVVFSSELKGVTEQLGLSDEVPDEALASYLAAGQVFAPYTWNADVKKLVPGEIRVYTASGVKQCWHTYWQQGVPTHDMSMDDAVATVEAALDDSFLLSSAADPSIEKLILWSEGIDSTLIVKVLDALGLDTTKITTTARTDTNANGSDDDEALGQRIYSIKGKRETVALSSKVQWPSFAAALARFDEPHNRMLDVHIRSQLYPRLAERSILALHGGAADYTVLSGAFLESALLYEEALRAHKASRHPVKLASKGLRTLRRLFDPKTEIEAYVEAFVDQELDASKIETVAPHLVPALMTVKAALVSQMNSYDPQSIREAAILYQFNVRRQHLFHVDDHLSLGTGLETRDNFLDFDLMGLFLSMPIGVLVSDAGNRSSADGDPDRNRKISKPILREILRRKATGDEFDHIVTGRKEGWGSRIASSFKESVSSPADMPEALRRSLDQDFLGGIDLDVSRRNEELPPDVTENLQSLQMWKAAQSFSRENGLTYGTGP